MLSPQPLPVQPSPQPGAGHELVLCPGTVPPQALPVLLIHFLLCARPLQLPLKPVCCLSHLHFSSLSRTGSDGRNFWDPGDRELVPQPTTLTQDLPPLQTHWPTPLDPAGLRPRVKARLVGGCLGSGRSCCVRRSEDLDSSGMSVNWVLSSKSRLVYELVLLMNHMQNINILALL